MVINTKYKKTLLYTSPCHGDWGIIRVAAQVPESYQLFVCPAACGRHGALGAFQHGYKDRLSYLFIDKNDIIKGYDEIILQGVEDLLRRIKKYPRVVFIYVSCLDDLIGTDHDSVCAELSKKYLDIDFRSGHMNPIAMDGNRPPLVTTFEAMFSLLQKWNKKPYKVNTIGNLMPVAADNEFYEFMKYHGFFEVEHIANFDNYNDFLAMSESCLNLVLSPAAVAAANDLKNRIDTPCERVFISYDLEEIEKNYAELERTFNNNKTFDFKRCREKTEDEIAKTLTVLGDTPIAVGCGATVRPCSLARALLKYGFNVTILVVDKVIPPDQAAFEDLEGSNVTIERISPQGHNYILERRNMPDCVAIGFEASYITMSKHIVPLCDDEGMFGYGGVVKVMEMLRKAKCSESQLKPLLDRYGAII